MNVNGKQLQLGGRVPAALINDLQVQMKEGGGSLAIRFAEYEEVTDLAKMLGVNPEGVFPTLVGKLGTGLDSGYREAELTLNVWPNRRH